MRKYLVALLSVMMILAFAVSSDARHEVKDQFEYQPQVVKSSKAMITLGGHIRIRGEISDNNSDLRDTDENDVASEANDDWRDDEAHWNQRVRLNLKATVSPNSLAFVELESADGSTEDKLDGSDGWTWGTGAEGASGLYQVSNSKRGDLRVRQAYISHQNNALGVPAGFKAGHMLLALGNGLFFDHSKFGDDAILFWISPADAIEISLIGIKFEEGSSSLSDDTDAYVVSVEGGAGPVNFSADVTYVVDNNFAFSADEGDRRVNMNLWNIGLRADADAGPVNIYGDVEFQTGEIEDGDADTDLSGYAAMVGAEANVGAVTVHGEFAYGSGDENIEDPNDDEFEGFITSIGSGQHYTYLYDQHVITAAGASNTGLSNTWYLNAGLSAKAGSDIKISADLYYLEASEKVAEDSPTTTEDTEIGVELDGKITYQIDTNLVYYVEAGYLWAGDFYENVTGDDGNIDNPWSVRQGIVFNF
ncbi:MAG: hypothetical protein ABFR82_06240 [Nitrospirota bacterium]